MGIKIIAGILVLALSGCGNIVRNDPGTLSVKSGETYSAVKLLYSPEAIDACDISSAEQIDADNTWHISTKTASSVITCTKNGQQVAEREIAPRLWETKYKQTTKNVAVTSFVMGGLIGLAVNQAVTPSDPKVGEVSSVFNVYPPIMAVASNEATLDEKSSLQTMLNNEYREYTKNLPKDCNSGLHREYNALCSTQMINTLRADEKSYVGSVQTSDASLNPLRGLVQKKLYNRQAEVMTTPEVLPEPEIEVKEVIEPEIIPFQEAAISDIQPEIQETPQVKESVILENQPLEPVLEEALLSEDTNALVEEKVPFVHQDENWE